MLPRNFFAFSALILGAHAYKLIDRYDGKNWYESFTFETLPDPTHGFVDYISQSEAASRNMTYTIGTQVYLGVDHSTVISPTDKGRKSIWLESKKSFQHGLLIGDFAHVPGSICGLWPAFWTIQAEPGAYGEIDIIEGFSDLTYGYTSLHTEDVSGKCSFTPPAKEQTGTSNQNSFDCASGIGCSVKSPEGSYGSPLNENSGGVWAMEKTSSAINIWFFPRHTVPYDINSEEPNPSGWGPPTANFESKYGDCDLDAHFTAQTIYFDTDFCGGDAGGVSWSAWTDCSAKTGKTTCEEYVAASPGAFKEAYWLINSVLVYQ